MFFIILSLNDNATLVGFFQQLCPKRPIHAASCLLLSEDCRELWNVKFCMTNKPKTYIVASLVHSSPEDYGMNLLRGTDGLCYLAVYFSTLEGFDGGMIIIRYSPA